MQRSHCGYDTRSHQSEPRSVQNIFCRIFCSLFFLSSYWFPYIAPYQTHSTGSEVQTRGNSLFKEEGTGATNYTLPLPRENNFYKDLTVMSIEKLKKKMIKMIKNVKVFIEKVYNCFFNNFQKLEKLSKTKLVKIGFLNSFRVHLLYFSY